MYDEPTAGTYTPPWLLRTANVQGKYRFWSPGEWDFAACTGFLTTMVRAAAVEAWAWSCTPRGQPLHRRVGAGAQIWPWHMTQPLLRVA